MVEIGIKRVPLITKKTLIIYEEYKPKVRRFRYWNIMWIIIVILVTYGVAWLLGAINNIPTKEFFP